MIISAEQEAALRHLRLKAEALEGWPSVRPVELLAMLVELLAVLAPREDENAR